VCCSEGRELLGDPAQGVLDLGVELMLQVRAMVGLAGGPELFRRGPAGLGQPIAIRPGRLVGADSRVLFRAVAQVFTALGFDGLGDKVFRDLAITAVVEPTFDRTRDAIEAHLTFL
jgi:hypothetical protein